MTKTKPITIITNKIRKTKEKSAQSALIWENLRYKEGNDKLREKKQYELEEATKDKERNLEEQEKLDISM